MLMLVCQYEKQNRKNYKYQGKKDIKDKVVDFQIILGRMLPYTRDLAKGWLQIY